MLIVILLSHVLQCLLGLKVFWSLFISSLFSCCSGCQFEHLFFLKSIKSSDKLICLDHHQISQGFLFRCHMNKHTDWVNTSLLSVAKIVERRCVFCMQTLFVSKYSLTVNSNYIWFLVIWKQYLIMKTNVQPQLGCSPACKHN